MPCVVCREVVVGVVCAMIYVTDNYLWWASSHCARTPATTDGDLAQLQALAQPKLAQHPHQHINPTPCQPMLQCPVGES